jgi:hypothetical protein
MALSKSTIVVSGEIGDLARTSIVGVTDAAALATFAAAYMALSDGGLESTHFSERVVTEGAPETGSNSDKRADCYFQDIDTGAVLSLTLVAPKSTVIEAVTGRDGGERVTAAAMATLKTALETATERDLKALYGYIVQKK